MKSLNPDELPFASLARLRRLVRARAVSSLELTRFFLKTLASAGPTYNALALLTPERAEREARRADARLGRGDAGALLGIPYATKDIAATAGLPTRWGSRVYKDQVFDYDATVVSRLRGVGAPLVGKLAMLELGGVGGYQYASASADGPGLNPWDRTWWSGGSSSGSASAVAAGLVPFALGGETMASVISPAAYCGVSGLRPSFGIVSRYGTLSLAWSIDKVGVIAGSAEDCGLVLAALVGVDPFDPSILDFKYSPTRKSAFRLGVLRTPPGASREVERSFADAIAELRRLGMTARTVSLPDHNYLDIARTIVAGETAATHEALIQGPLLGGFADRQQQAGLREFVMQPGSAYVRATEARVAATRDLRTLFGEVDALVTPTVLTEAPPIDTDLSVWQPRQRHGTSAPLSVLGAVAGLPAISVPMGFSPNGMPLGLSVIGDRFADADIIRIAALYQRATDWHQRHPQVQHIPEAPTASRQHA